MTQQREMINVTLRAGTGAPLTDEGIRGVVLGAAHELAERNGIGVLALEADDRSIVATLVGSEIVGVGFVAELRRNTERWYTRKTGRPTLWGISPS